MSKAKKVYEKQELTIGNIQDILWDSIHDLRNDETSAANVSAITNATGKILSSVGLQLKYAQLTGQKPSMKMLEK